MKQESKNATAIFIVLFGTDGDVATVPLRIVATRSTPKSSVIFSCATVQTVSTITFESFALAVLTLISIKRVFSGLFTVMAFFSSLTEYFFPSLSETSLKTAASAIRFVQSLAR